MSSIPYRTMARPAVTGIDSTASAKTWSRVSPETAEVVRSPVR